MFLFGCRFHYEGMSSPGVRNRIPGILYLFSRKDSIFAELDIIGGTLYRADLYDQ